MVLKANIIISGEIQESKVVEQFDELALYSIEEAPLIEETEEKTPLVLIILDWPTDEELKNLSSLIDPYHVFLASELEVITDVQLEFTKRMLPYSFNIKNIKEVLNIVTRATYKTQYGAKLLIKNIEINQQIEKFFYNGNNNLQITLNSPDNAMHLLTWKNNIFTEIDKPIEIWPEFNSDQGVELTYKVVRMMAGSHDSIIYSKSYTSADLTEPIVLEESGRRDYITISVEAKGNGNIEIGPVHWRYSKLSLGKFFVGGKRFSDSKRQEFFHYFHPGDLKPPLNIYFSGYRTAEGFEGYPLMKSFGTPFLLFTDPRLEGGSFYLGSKEYEQGILDVINTYLDYLNFDHQQLILSGLSMGTYGALYYGLDLNPHAIVLGKPLASLGQVAKNILTIRPNTFGTASDLMLGLTNGTAEENVIQMNDRFWNKFKKSNLKDTKLYASYMRDDDYDPNAFIDIIDNSTENQLHLVSKSFEGRHNDNTSGIVKWFVYRFQEILSREFKRDFNGME